MTFFSSPTQEVPKNLEKLAETRGKVPAPKADSSPVAAGNRTLKDEFKKVAST